MPYNQTCDVYSFSLLLWQIFSLKVPYGRCDRSTLQNRVWSGTHVRPQIEQDWPAPIKKILFRGWSPNIRSRPDMNDIERTLRVEVAKFKDIDLSAHMTRRRSTFVMIGMEGLSLRSLTGTSRTWLQSSSSSLHASSSRRLKVEDRQ